VKRSDLCPNAYRKKILQRSLGQSSAILEAQAGWLSLSPEENDLFAPGNWARQMQQAPR